MRIGLLTGGGDCPGLNAVIRAVVRKGIDVYDDQLIGFRDGWRGVLEADYDELTMESTRGSFPAEGRSSAARAPTCSSARTAWNASRRRLRAPASTG